MTNNTEEWRWANIQSDGYISTYSGTSAVFDIALAQGSGGNAYKTVRTVLFSTPGIAGSLYAVFLDGNSTSGTALTGSLYLATQPTQGFIIGKNCTTGSLGISLGNRSSGNTTVYALVKYSYQ